MEIFFLASQLQEVHPLINPKVVLLGCDSHINSQKLIPERGFIRLQMIENNSLDGENVQTNN